MGEVVLSKIPAKWSLKPLIEHMGSLVITKNRLVLRASFFALRFYSNIPFDRIIDLEISPTSSTTGSVTNTTGSTHNLSSSTNSPCSSVNTTTSSRTNSPSPSSSPTTSPRNLRHSSNDTSSSQKELPPKLGKSGGSFIGTFRRTAPNLITLLVTSEKEKEKEREREREKERDKDQFPSQRSGRDKKAGSHIGTTTQTATSSPSQNISPPNSRKVPPPLNRGRSSTAVVPRLAVEEFEFKQDGNVNVRDGSVNLNDVETIAPVSPMMSPKSVFLKIIYLKKGKREGKEKLGRMKIVLKDSSMISTGTISIGDSAKAASEAELIKRLWNQRRDSISAIEKPESSDTTPTDVTTKFYNTGALSELDWNHLLSSTQLRFFRKNEVIIEEGQVTIPQLFFIHKGHCRVEQHPVIGPSDKKAVVIGVVRPREIFGEISFLSKTHRAAASVVAIDESVCLSIISLLVSDHLFSS
eukprot:TRINITY_DN2052_c0_g1_i2.p1 TRINITY_DN2052_c0_g1~~TRINITY_DN2052_c0_g1_i2.p1  ORF type:complete len:468 (-),score=87.01 TRINITY_DN2052_c0_g1_i2:77-1480(-)